MEKTGPDDPLLSGRFQVTITGLVGDASGTYSPSPYTLVNLVNLLREMNSHRDQALRIIWSNFLIIREEGDKGIDEAKDVLIEKIAAYWNVKITRKQLEPKTEVEWCEIEDLKLPYDAAKLPAIRKRTVTVEPVSPSLEDQLASGEFDVN